MRGLDVFLRKSYHTKTRKWDGDAPRHCLSAEQLNEIKLHGILLY
jgi:hypothetical protein